MPSTTIRDRLALIEDLDPDFVLHNLGGQMRVLDRVMRTFALTYGEGLPGLLAADQDSADGNARSRMICHSARGALTSIGAAKAGAMAWKVECDLREAATGPAAHARRRQLHESVLTLVGHVTLAIHSREASELLWPASVS